MTKLCELGALARVDDGAPHVVRTELTEAGRELLAVRESLHDWLARAPNGPLSLGSSPATGAIRALIAGWDARIVRALAEQPLSLTELDKAISDFSYPTLERRLQRLRSTNLVRRVEGMRRSKPYAVTEWLRHAIAPLCLAARWEERHVADAPPVTRIEVEAAFLLTLASIELSPSSSGSCSLAVLTSEADGKDVAGVKLAIERGRVASCKPGPAENPTTWALGTAADWLEAVIECRPSVLRIGGVEPLTPRHVVRETHRLLFS